MRPKVTKRFWIEALFAGASAFLAALTIVWRDWIEAAFGVDPDGGTAALEWAIVTALVLAALVAALIARADLRAGRAAQLVGERA